MLNCCCFLMLLWSEKTKIASVHQYGVKGRLGGGGGLIPAGYTCPGLHGELRSRYRRKQNVLLFVFKPINYTSAAEQAADCKQSLCSCLARLRNFSFLDASSERSNKQVSNSVRGNEIPPTMWLHGCPGRSCRARRPLWTGSAS